MNLLIPVPMPAFAQAIDQLTFKGFFSNIKTGYFFDGQDLFELLVVFPRQGCFFFIKCNFCFYQGFYLCLAECGHILPQMTHPLAPATVLLVHCLPEFIVNRPEYLAFGGG